MIEQEPLQQRTDVKLEKREEAKSKFGLLIKLTEDQKADLFNSIKQEMDVIDTQRNGMDFEANLQSYRNQYWGKVAEKSTPYANSFSTHVHLTMRHVNQVEIRAKQAFFDSDPIISVSPRPGQADEEGFKIAKKKEEFMDYEMDVNMRTREHMGKIFHEWANLGVGICKLVWGNKTERIVDEETYHGIRDLQKFLDNYPDAPEENPEFITKLENDEEVELMVEYTAPVYNAPLISWVKLEDFYINSKTDGLEGVKDAHLIGEKLNYNWHDLQKKVADDFFDEDDIDELRLEEKDGRKIVDSSYLSKDFDIREVIYHYKLNPADKHETKITVWLDFEKKKILRVVYFPYWHRRPYYIPFFFTNKRAGFYQAGLAEMLQHSNIVANAIINFMLDTAFIQNLVLFKVKKNSDMFRMMASRKWYPGFPIVYNEDPNEIEQFNINKQDLNGLLTLFSLNSRLSEDISGVSNYMTGKESPTDPQAPAAKTMALLQEGNINIKEYVANALPSMNELGHQTMELFYQFSREGKEYRVTGSDTTENISREALRYRTDYQAQAYGFDFEKLNQAKVGMMLFQLFGNDPELAQAPMGRYNFIYEIFKQAGSNWDKKVDKIMMAPEEVEQYKAELFKEAVKEHLEAKEQQQQREQLKQQLIEAGIPAEQIVAELEKRFPVANQQRQPQPQQPQPMQGGQGGERI